MDIYALDGFPMTHDERVLVSNMVRACDTATLTRSLMRQYLQWASARRAMIAYSLKDGSQTSLAIPEEAKA